MKQYMMVTAETLIKLSECFAGSDEIESFMVQLDSVSKEMNFLRQLRQRVDDDEGVEIFLKQTCFFTIFCREHLELIHQLIGKFEARPPTHEEMLEIEKNEEDSSD